jgi:hypothetical protein
LPEPRPQAKQPIEYIYIARPVDKRFPFYSRHRRAVKRGDARGVGQF